MVDFNIIIKFISIPSLFLLCFIFGILPFCVSKLRMNESFLSYANTFSGGLFFGIGLFHLLPEGVEKLEDFSDHPIPYFFAAGGYTLILFIQKVAFGNFMENAENFGENEVKKKDIKNEFRNSQDNGLLYDDNEEDEEEKKHEETLINLVSMKLDKNDSGKDNKEKTDTTSYVSSTTSSKETEELRKKKLSGYIMLLALSIHGMFECLALGIQGDTNNTLFLFIALMIHKWAEAFSLGIFFIKGRLEKKHYMWLITLFSCIGPFGVLLGILLSKTTGENVEGIFLSLSTGTFLYVACSEVIVEEFSNPVKRYFKFFLYFLGIVFAVGLTLFEYYTD